MNDVARFCEAVGGSPIGGVEANLPPPTCNITIRPNSLIGIYAVDLYQSHLNWEIECERLARGQDARTTAIFSIT